MVFDLSTIAADTNQHRLAIDTVPLGDDGRAFAVRIFLQNLALSLRLDYAFASHVITPCDHRYS
ncbi:MAG: hypothetical protein BWZ07_03090 [Alphaproteobacteria bacterium ADurb.BinA280]|nr:MAG: hypothetical protein BWZ07_03090 [Alphaproteobacteria bacterium ADurb.BinA280]